MKKALSALLVLIIVLPILIVCFSVPVSAEGLYKHKIVSILYDNSADMGSMFEDKNKIPYASYALQSFCGMLNSEDQLYISYMSDLFVPEGEWDPKVDLSNTDSMGKELCDIQNITYGAITPYDMIEKAFNLLTPDMNRITDSKYWLDENTEYWFVVITNGIFTNDAGGPYYCGESDKDSENLDQLQKDLNEDCEEYLNQTMPNGTKPQITFMGIKNTDSDVLVLPTIEHENLQVEVAVGNEGVTDKMSNIADKISGRKRLESDSASGKKDKDYYYANESEDESVISVRSDIPLLNIAVFSQGTDAQITEVKHNSEPVGISRTAKIYVEERTDLTGHTYLIGDSQTSMGSGEYLIYFDKEVDLSNIDIMIEPALEAKVNIQVNDTELELDKIENLNEYLNNNMMVGDPITLSYDIFEMGDLNGDSDEIPDLSGLSPNYTISVYEDGKLVKEVSGKGEVLTDYKVKQVKTKIVAGITMPGFSPIVKTIEFTPKAYVPTYTVTSSISDEKCVLKEDVSKNQDVQVSFTVFADGVQITDLNVVKGLSPVITTSVSGNDGDVTYTDDGKIVFTPNKASARPGKDAVFDVDVTCTIKTLWGVISAREKYSVDASIFEVVFVAPDKTIKKTELYGNTVAATFYVMKEGVKLNGSEVGNDFSITLNRSRKDLKTDVRVSDDGTITVTPQSEKKHEKGFFLTYWLKYFTLNGTDIEITLEHQRGTASGTLDVVGGDGAYVFFNVLLWLGIEILITLAIFLYILRFITKARFASNARLYFGTISNDGSNCILRLNRRSMKGECVNNLWNPFKRLTFDVGKISLEALYGGMVLCDSPWFDTIITTVDGTKGADKIFEECKKAAGKGVQLNPIKGPKNIEIHTDTGINSDSKCFYILPQNVKEAQGNIIEKASVFCYVLEE